MIAKATILITAGVLALGCVPDAPIGKSKLQDRLKIQTTESGSKETVTYVTRFESETEAGQHTKDMEAAGAGVKVLDHEGRILVITASKTEVAKSWISDDAAVTLNSEMLIRRPAGTVLPTAVAESDSSNDAQAFLTARRVTGVSELASRIAAADGRNVKVAVFDTGIDFGLEGIDLQSDGSRKLTGFYDLTGFGKVSPVAASLVSNQVVVDGKVLTFTADIGVSEITMAGVLSERQLAVDYMTAEGVDLNGNDTFDDEFAYVVGRNRDGVQAVWVDANRNFNIDSRSAEELTDYNTTFVSIPMATQQPSGARPLAVTLSSQNGVSAIQFHTVSGGHGSSCAIIIAGDGYADGQLQGMAPKAQLVAYMLDATGQDVYTIDEFLLMFLHARDQKVDAISISWGFATADLTSARFVSEFLDQEIAANGIVVGIAAGNEGPGISSALNDDYIPHHGFAVGAYISQDQARNVYGWVGDVRDDVIWYSSVGPSRGGRQIPDVVSPLMSLVRGERGTSGQRFYGFGGTSSATPALIGSVAALMSAIKAESSEQIDVRLLKLAIQNTATPLAGIETSRTGAGLINVSRAYEAYQRLVSEFRLAKLDPMKRTKFAYDVRASTPLEGLAQDGEGIHLRSFRPTATVRLNLTEESLKLIDPLVFFEAVTLWGEGDFFETQNVIGLQAVPAAFDVRFKPEALAVPGTYTGQIKVIRPFDQTVLATIPVVVEIPQHAAVNGAIATLNRDFEALDVWRQSVKLTADSAIEVRGVAMDNGQGHNGDLRVVVVAADGNVVSSNRIAITTPVNLVDFTTDRLQAGIYELLVFRNFGRPAVLTGLTVNLGFTLPSADLLNVGFDGRNVQLALSARAVLTVKRAQLVLDKFDSSTQLMVASENQAFTKKFKAFYGETSFAVATDALDIRLVQSDFSRAFNPMSNVELVAVDKMTLEVLHRGWTNFGSKNGSAAALEFPTVTHEVVWAAWSNIVDWSRQGAADPITLIVTRPLTSVVDVSHVVGATFSAGQNFGLSIEIPETDRPLVKAGVTGTLKLLDASGVVLESLSVRL